MTKLSQKGGCWSKRRCSVITIKEIETY